jgi:hypothetical protein
MKKVLKLTESNLIKLIKNIIKEQGEEEVVISPEEYYTLLKNVYYQAHAIPRLRKFRGKKLVIDGDLDFSPFRNEIHLTDLGPIKVNGNLDISYTKIKSLDDVEVSGTKRYWNTPYENVINARKHRAKQNEQEERRENDEWNLNDTDQQGEKANAAFEYAVNEGELKSLDEEQKEELENLKTRFSELEQQIEAEEDEERYDELSNELDEVQEEIDGFEDYVDVYDLYPSGSHYDMDTFESLSTGVVFAVGTIREADDSMESYYEDMLDDLKSYFSREYLSGYIDSEKVQDYFRYAVEEWVRDDPESYGIDKELSDSQKEDIWLLEMEKWVYENEGVRFPIKYPTKEENGRIFDFMDENEEHEFQYRNESSDPHRSHWVLYKDGAVVPPHQIYDDEDTEDHQDDRDSRISDIEYEIQEIKDNPDGDLDESSVESAIEDYLENIERDPLGFLQDMGYTDFNEFLNLDELKDDLISQGDYGETLNGYNGTYDEITINGTDYIVMRID